MRNLVRHVSPGASLGILFSPRTPVQAALLAVLVVMSAPANGWSRQVEATLRTEGDPAAELSGEAAAAAETRFIQGARQLTLEGKRAGEGYFGPQGKSLVFQSERQDDNPFFQIYWMDLENGDLERISPGIGKTTCAWIHPTRPTVLFASTHDDPDARRKQTDELALRAENKQRRYSWDYDEHYELYMFDRDSRRLSRLTNARGYDAEGSWSPDGGSIAFCSNRHAYEHPPEGDGQAHFARDPSWQADIYLMASDGTNIRRLTDVPGYDGGPFFSPDGARICFRRFNEEGTTAEIMTMRTDGTDQQQLTRLGYLSWAPYYHPSGDYLIFATNRHGFENFELYLVSADGRSTARVTHTAGFDGLASFSPDGKRITWTSNRTANKTSQIFVANWNDSAARDALGLNATSAPAAPSLAAQESADPTRAGESAAQLSTPEISPQDILRHVNYLCLDQLAGRMTGTEGERLATEYVASYMKQLGLQPAGDNGTYFQEFPFTSGMSLGSDNKLQVLGEESPLPLDQAWRPLAFSSNGTVEPTEVVFAGYGIVAPAENGGEEYDSYVHLDVQDKWVLTLRFLPEKVSAERRQQLSRHASLRRKAMVARERGARGLIVVTGPATEVKQRLIPLQFDGSLGGSGLPAITLEDAVAEAWLKTAGVDLRTAQTQLDEGAPQMGTPLPMVKLSATIDVEHVQRIGRNVLGRLPAVSASGAAIEGASSPDPAETVLVGAHVDHLGQGANSSSLAREDEASLIHYGADDNASGTAAMLEMAEALMNRSREGKWRPRRDVMFAAWSGEELGLLGSSYFAKQWSASHRKVTEAAQDNDSTGATASPHAATGQDGGLSPSIAAYVNLDMVGRLDKKLILQGVGSAANWSGEIERRNAPLGIPITIQDDGYLPTDASTFYLRQVPILSAFTGSHSEYHTPRDTPATLNYDGAAMVATLLAQITSSLATADAAPTFIPPKVAAPDRPRAALRAYLGTIPDYAETEVKGVKLSGVAGDGPASKAGVRGGDLIVELAGRKIENIYDYTFAIEALKVGAAVEIVVERDGTPIKLTVTPGSRE